MHIIYTTKIYLPHIGGVELYIKKLADYFVSKGNSVTVITADEEVPHLVEEKSEEIKILRIPAKSVGGIFFLKKKKDIVKIKSELEKADIVHVNDCKFLFRFFALEKKYFHYKLICSSHGWLFHTNNHSFIKRLYFKNVVAKASCFYDSIISVSEQDKTIAEKYGFSCDTVIYPGVNCYKYAGLPRKDFCENIFFYWGRISQNKGILEALRKFSSLKSDFKFIIAGKCEDESYMKLLSDFISRNGMYEKVNFIGQLSDSEIREKIIESDFIVLPSLHEGFGITLVECLCSGRPIIANKNDSYSKILSLVGSTEYLFDFQDKKTDLNEKISELQRKKISPRNIEQFSDVTVFEKIEKIYSLC